MDKNRKIGEVINVAKKLVGVPYKYGAKMSDAPNFFDCSGFIKYIFEQVGYEVPRSTIEQAEFVGERVESINNIISGDLIFLHGERGHYNKTFPKGIGHVVMYIGDNNIIHASSKRIKEYPNIEEDGQVKISDLDYVIKNSGPIIIIKRIVD